MALFGVPRGRAFGWRVLLRVKSTGRASLAILAQMRPVLPRETTL